MSKQIILDENYCIESDAYCWVLKFSKEKETTDKEGNKKIVVSKNETYHASFNDAIKKYVYNSLKQAESLSDIKNIVDKILEKIKQIKIHHEKTIDGKEYELVVGECEQCAFKKQPIGCNSPMLFEDECMKDDADKIWKEVSDEQK